MADNDNVRQMQELRSEAEKMVLIFEIVSSQIDRLEIYEDGTLKFLIMTEIMNTMLDMGVMIVLRFFNEEVAKYTARNKDNMSECDQIKADVLTRVTACKNKLQAFFNDFKQHILTPHLSPDHPFGHHLMEQGRVSFHNLRDAQFSEPVRKD